jgi:hypothetical protein
MPTFSLVVTLNLLNLKAQPVVLFFTKLRTLPAGSSALTFTTDSPGFVEYGGVCP